MLSRIHLTVVILALIASLGLISCQTPKPAAPAKPAVADTSPIGTAQLAPDGSLRVMLLAQPDAKGNPPLVGQSLSTFKPGSADYARYMKHIGGLTPGQSKPVPPFP